MIAPAQNKVAAWLVDLDGTLYRANWLRLAIGTELFLTAPRAIAAIRAFRSEHERMRNENVQVDANDSPFAAQVRRAAQQLGMHEFELHKIIRFWMIEKPAKWLRLFRRRTLIHEIAVFHHSGGRTALVSDYPAQDKLVALGAAHLFDIVVANGETQGLTRLKPSPDGYLLAAQRLGVSPADCLVVGDRHDADGVAAERAGMKFRYIR